MLILIGTPRVNNLLSISAFYRYHTYTRTAKTFIQSASSLFQQHIVDIWLSVEMRRLEYYYFNQHKLRAYLYDTARPRARSWRGVENW